jgi:hypothetical protein
MRSTKTQRRALSFEPIFHALEMRCKMETLTLIADGFQKKYPVKRMGWQSFEQCPGFQYLATWLTESQGSNGISAHGHET